MEGAGSWVWTADLLRAYRPLSAPLLGIADEGEVFLDIAPPFRCRTSARTCACTTRAVVWLLRLSCFSLDDFVGIESSRSRAEEAYSELNKLMSELA